METLQTSLLGMQSIQAGRKFGLPLFLGVFIGAFFVIFALQNTLVTTVKVFSWSFSLPLALFVAGALCAGALATVIAMIPGFIKDERYIKRLENEKRAAEDELSKYRIVIPIAPPEQSMQMQGMPVYVRPMTKQQN
ncbi:MAG TPA: LapA family protein [Candidatus Paceibacterota bacterium]